MTTPPMILDAATAADLMTPNPISIRDSATIKEAVAFLADRGFSAAPVIDAAGRPIGVLSGTDIVLHNRETVRYASAPGEDRSAVGTYAEEVVPEGFLVEEVDPTPVRDLMTPAVFSVTPDTPAARVVEEMLALRVHRLFVVGHNGALIGVISAVDVLRHLHAAELVPAGRARAAAGAAR